MSLEAKIELLTAAVTELTRAMQTQSGFAAQQEAVQTMWDANTVSQTRVADTGIIEVIEQSKEVPNAEPESSTQKSAEPSVQTGDLSSPGLTYKDHVKPATLKLSQQKGRDVAIAVLARFGVKGAQDLDESQWADYVAHVDKVLAGGEV